MVDSVFPDIEANHAVIFNLADDCCRAKVGLRGDDAPSNWVSTLIHALEEQYQQLLQYSTGKQPPLYFEVNAYGLPWVIGSAAGNKRDIYPQQLAELLAMAIPPEGRGLAFRIQLNTCLAASCFTCPQTGERTHFVKLLSQALAAKGFTNCQVAGFPAYCTTNGTNQVLLTEKYDPNGLNVGQQEECLSAQAIIYTGNHPDRQPSHPMIEYFPLDEERHKSYKTHIKSWQADAQAEMAQYLQRAMGPDELVMLQTRLARGPQLPKMASPSDFAINRAKEQKPAAIPTPHPHEGGDLPPPTPANMPAPVGPVSPKPTRDGMP